MSKYVAFYRVILIIIFVLPLSLVTQSQDYFPVSVTGFNHDVIAETGNSSLTTTTSALDGVTISNKVMYTIAFRTANGFAGGGIPNNGIIPEPAGGFYQLAAYNVSNALIVPRSQTGNLVLPTPAKFSALRLLAFSTEGPSLVNITLFFTDGSSSNALVNYTVPDWFNGTANLILQGFGRVTRATPATGADAFPANPRLYYIQVPLTCTDRQKDLASIRIANVTTAGTNAPFPNAVIFAVSGRSSAITVLPTVTNATCTSNGSASIAITGNTAPYTVSWNSVPVQTGTTATNLLAGNYTATITDVNGCVSTSNVTVGLTNNINLVANTDTSVCFGASFTANTISNATSFNWSPVTGVSNPAIANPILNPATTTTYTVTGTLGSCVSSRSFTVTVIPQINLNVPPDTTICLGASFIPGISGTGITYSWSPVAGVSNPTIPNPVLSPAATTTYTITSTSGNCSTTKNYTVTVVSGVSVNAGNDITIVEGQSVVLSGTGSPGIYLWTPATGLSATNILTPRASPQLTTTYTLSVSNTLGCTGTDNVTITVIPFCIKPMEAISPNGDGRNDVWVVSTGNCLASTNVKVFNRYGNTVYHNAKYNNDWQGTFNGKPLPDGTYYYVIEYNLLNSQLAFRRGSLTIIR